MARRAKVAETTVTPEQFLQHRMNDDAESLLTSYRAYIVEGTKAAEEWAEYEGVTPDEMGMIAATWKTLSRIAEQVHERLPDAAS